MTTGRPCVRAARRVRRGRQARSGVQTHPPRPLRFVTQNTGDVPKGQRPVTSAGACECQGTPERTARLLYSECVTGKNTKTASTIWCHPLDSREGAGSASENTETEARNLGKQCGLRRPPEQHTAPRRRSEDLLHTLRPTGNPARCLAHGNRRKTRLGKRHARLYGSGDSEAERALTCVR